MGLDGIQNNLAVSTNSQQIINKNDSNTFSTKLNNRLLIAGMGTGSISTILAALTENEKIQAASRKKLKLATLGGLICSITIFGFAIGYSIYEHNKEKSATYI